MNTAVHTENRSLSPVPLLVSGDDWNVLTAIYDDDVNIAIARQLMDGQELSAVVSALLNHPQTPSVRMSGNPQQCYDAIINDLPHTSSLVVLAEAVKLLAEAFSTLFDLDKVGLRIDRLQRAMCPRFHVDHVPVRLLWTLAGPATEWLPEKALDRSQLRGAGEPCTDTNMIQQLKAGDIALIKGEAWEGNEGRGLVHRSPALLPDEQRLVLTMDFA